MDEIVVSETTQFYKHWVIRRKGSREDYNTTEQYFKKYGKGTFQFETCWAYIQYKKWIESDAYVGDIAVIKKTFKENIINGFNSLMEETIMMEDDEEIKQEHIMMRDAFNLLKTDDEKMDYLSVKYDEDMYYPNGFCETWLFDLFEDRIVSDI